MDTTEPTSHAPDASNVETDRKPKMSRRGCGRMAVVLILLASVGLVVFSIYSQTQKAGRLQMRNAYRLHVGLVSYANAHDGVFPNEKLDGSPLQTSNDAFAALVAGNFTDDPKIFYVQGSAWHGTLAPSQMTPTLGPGENHWGYFSSLTIDRSANGLPLIIDCGILNRPGRWTDDPKLPGGLREGKAGLSGNHWRYRPSRTARARP